MGRRSIGVNKTDLDVLMQIATQGFQTFDMLRRGSLCSFTREHSWAEMKRLRLLGLINVVPADTRGGNGWIISSLGKRTLKRHVAGSSFEIAPQVTNFSTLRHDTILQSIRCIFERTNKVRDWVPEFKLRALTQSRVRHLNANVRSLAVASTPDATFDLVTSTHTIRTALEIELSLKSQRRLFKRFEAQITNQDYEICLYVVEGDRLLRKLLLFYERVLCDSSRVRSHLKPNGIYFCLLNDLQTDGLNTRFSGLNDSFNIANL